MLPKLFEDVSCLTASVQARLDAVSASGVLWQASPCKFMLNVPGIARYLVVSGSSVTIDPAVGVSRQLVEYYFRMAPLAALLYQRGQLALHASAISDGKRVILLAGESGAGKSTLMTAMLRRGWRMLADELAMLCLEEQGQIMVWPICPDIALWPDAYEKFGMEFVCPTDCDANRRLCSFPEKFEVEPLPLQTIYWLGVHNNNGCDVKTVNGADRFSSTGLLLYNSHIAHALCDQVAYMRIAAAIAQNVPITRLRRPRGTWSVEELADIVEKGCRLNEF